MPLSSRAPRAGSGCLWCSRLPVAPLARSVVLPRAAAGRFKQEPSPALGLVNPNFEQAGGRDVAVFVAHVVDLAQARRQALVVVAQLRKHVLWIDIVSVIVEKGLTPGDVSDRAQTRPADLSRTFGDRVGHGENLVAVLIQKQMVVAEMRAAHVPMEVLGLHIEREDIGQQSSERGR